MCSGGEGGVLLVHLSEVREDNRREPTIGLEESGAWWRADRPGRSKRFVSLVGEELGNHHDDRDDDGQSCVGMCMEGMVVDTVRGAGSGRAVGAQEGADR